MRAVYFPPPPRLIPLVALVPLGGQAACRCRAVTHYAVSSLVGRSVTGDDGGDL